MDIKLKKTVFLILILGALSGLFAQKGLFNLSYGNSMAEVDSILASHGFYAEDSTPNVVKYYSDENELVDAIMVFIEPEKQRLAGWFVKYNEDNGDENDFLAVQRISKMHGMDGFYDVETDQLVWTFSDTRSLHVMYSAQRNLTALYYDSSYAELFKM